VSEGSIRQKRRRSGRRGRMVVLGLILIGAGLVVFRYSADIAGQLDSYISRRRITATISPGSSAPEAGISPSRSGDSASP